MSNQNIIEATNRLCEIITSGYLLAETLPADFLNVIADRLKDFENALRFIATQEDKTGNWAVELAKKTLNEAGVDYNPPVSRCCIKDSKLKDIENIIR